MRVCIPIREGSGREAAVHNHFGSAPAFVLADTETGAAEDLPNPGAHHAHGSCRPLAGLAGRDLDAVVVGGMGVRAMQQIREAGLKIYYAGGGTVGEVLDALAAGRLPEMEEAHACTGHGHGHGRSGGCGHGHGRGR